MPDNAADLALYIVNTQYRDAQSIMAVIAQSIAIDGYSAAKERAFWLMHVDRGVAALRCELKTGQFALSDRQAAARHIAQFYRDELRESHGVELPPMDWG